MVTLSMYVLFSKLVIVLLTMLAVNLLFVLKLVISQLLLKVYIIVYITNLMKMK